MSNWRVIHGDCLELLRAMPDKSVDAIITDPPYGVAFRGNEWDSEIPNWIDDARRVASVVVFTTGVTTLWEYPKPDWVCCWYREASNSRSKLGGFSHWSPIVVYGNPVFPIDSMKLHAIQHAYPHGFPHPSPKPIAIMRWLVNNACRAGGTVLDPFCGSGSTGVACLQVGCDFVGIERELAYVEVARDRLASESAQGKLFGVPA